MPSTKFETTPEHSWRFEALGTQWEIVSSRRIDNELRELISDEIETFDSTYSRFRKDSLVHKMSQRTGEYDLPENARAIFDLYDELYALTDGRVTPLVGDTLASAGYDSDYSLKPVKAIRPVASYADIVRRKGSHIQLKEPVTIDIGAAGKGYLVDSIVDIMKNNGHTQFVVDGSGDMRSVGDRIETIGLENPLDIEEVVGAVELTNKALCASATNRRAWGDWHHIIDPATARPTEEIIATWVVADTALVADGLATALFFTSPQVLSTKYTYEYARMYADGGIEYSDYFAGRVFS